MSNFTISTKNVFVYAKYNIIQMIDVMVDYLKINQLVSQFVRRVPERVLEELGGGSV